MFKFFCSVLFSCFHLYFLLLIFYFYLDPSVRDWVVPDFSTTNPVDRVVGSIALMAAMKSYFDYKICLECSLPSITLLGTVDDWKQIRHRAERLVEFDAGNEY